jgi:predicted nuclease of predicted toxin-antitoxin system
MRLLIDMNLPPSLAAWLRSEGHDAVHVRELGLGHGSDIEVFTRAGQDSRIVITFDLDFGEIAGLVAVTRIGIVLLRLRSVRIPHMRERLRIALGETEDALKLGAVVLVEDTRIRIRPMPPGP